MSKNHTITDTVKNTIKRYNMLSYGDRLVVAVSGGPDSVCLLSILAGISKEMDLDLVVAHYDHGLRTGEDEKETELVAGLSRQYSLPMEYEKAAGLFKETASLEEKARELRYDFLKSVKSRYRATRIALGHNLNDQAETFLMRLLRGSGLTGLSGIPPVRDGIFIRPLIDTGRKQIMEYLELNKIEYASDSSNTDMKHLRNKIRLELIPELLQYQPRLIEKLGDLSSYLREENSFLELHSEKWVEDGLSSDNESRYYIELNEFNKLPGAMAGRIIRIIIRRISGNLHGFGTIHFDSVYNLIKASRPSGQIDLPGGLTVRREYNKLYFTVDKESFPPFSYRINKPGTYNIEEAGKKIFFKLFDRFNAPSLEKAGPDTALLNGDILGYPLVIRNFEPGDKFIPLGMTGHKKVKDFYIDNKIPLPERRLTPLLLHEGKIIWVCGHRIDNRYKVTPETGNILMARLDSLP